MDSVICPEITAGLLIPCTCKVAVDCNRNAASLNRLILLLSELSVFLLKRRLPFLIGDSSSAWAVPVAVQLSMFSVFAYLPTLSALYVGATGVMTPLQAQPPLLLLLFPVVPSGCFGFWLPRWSHRLIKPPFGQRSSWGVLWQDKHKRRSCNLRNCVWQAWCKWRQRQLGGWQQSWSNRSLVCCGLLECLCWGQFLGGCHGGRPVTNALLQQLQLQPLFSGDVPEEP